MASLWPAASQPQPRRRPSRGCRSSCSRAGKYLRCGSHPPGRRAPPVDTSGMGFQIECVAQHHGHRKNGCERVRDVLTCDIRRRAMNGFVKTFFVVTERRGRQHADRSRQMAAASERMSPKTFPVTMTSNSLQVLIRPSTPASTKRCESSTSGYSALTSITTSRHNAIVSSTFALLTEAQFAAAAACGLESGMGDACNFGLAVAHGIDSTPSV